MSTKTPKSQLKEMVDKNPALRERYKVEDTSESKASPQAGIDFEFTWEFKEPGGRTRRGNKLIRRSLLYEMVNKAAQCKTLDVVTASGKKAAENAACQKVLDLINAAVSKFGQDWLNSTQPNGMLPVLPIIETTTPPVVNSRTNSERHSSDSTIGQFKPDALEILQNVKEVNTIGQLKEFCEKNKLEGPNYSEQVQLGTDNVLLHKITCTVGHFSEFGIAKLKSDAKKIAALKVKEKMSSERTTSPTTIPTETGLKVKEKLPSEGTTSPASIAVETPVRITSGQGTKVTEKIIFFGDKLIGTGGTAKVYEGYFETPIRRAAVKICRKEDIHHEKNKELDIMRKLNDPNVVNYYITEDKGPYTYIVMELARCSLERAVEKENPSVPLCKQWATEITKGLIALHSQKIIHRDLKPSNVIISFTGVAKLTDFGISKELSSFTQGVVTDAGRGTIIWMPTEGLKAIGTSNFKLQPTFDIFSLGLTIFYTMMGGKHLFDHTEMKSPLETQANIVNYKPKWDWLAKNEWTSLRNLLKAMIDKDPTKRPDAKVCLEHPFFWDEKMGLKFVNAVANDLKNTKTKNSEMTNMYTALKSEMTNMYTGFCKQGKLSTNWKSRLCEEFQEFLNFRDSKPSEKKGLDLSKKKYKENSFLMLIEFIRDHDQHYNVWNEYKDGVLKNENIFGEDGSKYANYFITKFPELTTVLYTIFQDCKYHGLHIPPFYQLNKSSCFPQVVDMKTKT